MTLVLRALASVMRADYARIAEAYEPGRTVLVGHSLSFATRVFEEVHGAPAATLHLAPSIFRSDHQQPAYVPGADLSGLPVWVKRTMWWLVDRWLIDPADRPRAQSLAARARPRTGVAGVQGVAALAAPGHRTVSRVVRADPAGLAAAAPAHGISACTTSPMSTRSSPGLQAFLDRGSPPILFTPGSANRAASRFFAAALDATRRLGRRALFLTRYPEQLPADAWVRRVARAVRAVLTGSAALRRDRASRRDRHVRAGARRRSAAADDAARVRSAGQHDALVAAGGGALGAPATSSGANASRRRWPRCWATPGLPSAAAHWAREMRRSDPLAETCAALEALIP